MRPPIRGIINGRLLLGLDLTLEAQIVTGNGTPPNLSGVLDNAINAVESGSDSRVDAIFKGRTLVRTTGHGRPTAIVVESRRLADNPPEPRERRHRHAGRLSDGSAFAGWRNHPVGHPGC